MIQSRWLFLLFLSAAPIAAQAVPDPPSCRQCVIELATVVTLGGDGGAELPGRPTSVSIDARGRYWLSFSSSLPLVFGPGGRFVSEHGRRGAGPSELANGTIAAALPGDSVALLDGQNARMLILRPDLTVQRSVRLPGAFGGLAPIVWPDTVVLIGQMIGNMHPLHWVSLAGSAMRVFRSVGAAGNERPGIATYGIASNVRSGRFWTADATKFTLHEMTRVGTVSRSLVRDARWFVSRSLTELLGDANTPPASVVVALQQDDTGLLWVFVNTAADTWRRAWANIPPGRAELSSIYLQHTFLRKGVVEVIDQNIRRVIARREIKGVAVNALPGNRLAVYQEDDDGVPIVHVLQYRLRR